MKTEQKKRYQFYLLIFVVGLAFLLGRAGNLQAAYKSTTTTTRTVTETTAPAPAASVGQHQDIDFNITTKWEFQPTERVTGDVVVENSSREPLPATFHIKLYHNDSLLKELDTVVHNLKPGTTTFSLDEFGIPTINQSAASQGNWTIVVYQQDLGPAYSKETSFRILSSI